jgi:hypothetical protein
MKLDCADCHKPSADGMYYQQVTYQAACQHCHTLQFDPANPQLLLPHGDVSHLNAFLHSLPYQYQQLAPPAQQKAFATQQLLALMQRAHVQTPADLDREILFTSDPYQDHPPTAERPFFSGCAYCHEVAQPAGGGEPVVTRPEMAERWLAHGAFTHASHTFMQCATCHKADESSLASDIIMPPQSSCITCHHSQGSAPSNCLACHTFHSPQTVVSAIKAKWGLPSQMTQASASCPIVSPMSSFLVFEQKPKQ